MNRAKIFFIVFAVVFCGCKKKHTSLDYGMRGPHTWIGSKVSLVQDSLSYVVADTTVYGPVNADIKVTSPTQIYIWNADSNNYGQPLNYVNTNDRDKTITFARFYWKDYVSTKDTITFNYVNKSLVWHTWWEGSGPIGREQRFLHSL